MRHGRGQTIVEFAVLLGPIFLSIFSTMAIMLHAWEEEVAINAAVRTAQYAATADPTALDQDHARQAGLIGQQTLQPAMFASRIQVQPMDVRCGGVPPDGTVWVCVTHEPGSLVRAEVKGRPASLLPTFWNSSLMIDEVAVGHLQTFQR